MIDYKAQVIETLKADNGVMLFSAMMENYNVKRKLAKRVMARFEREGSTLNRTVYIGAITALIEDGKLEIGVFHGKSYIATTYLS